MRGFARLQTAGDLLKKVRHEHELLRQDPSSTYVAFNFFITAHHLLDWLHPGFRNAERERIEREHVLLQVVSQLANGSKHFVLEAKKHQSVVRVDAPDGAFDAGAFDSDSFDTDELVVVLDGAAAAQFGESIHVVRLAEMVLDFWVRYFQQNNVAE
jgi:hypothetical protein